MSSLLAPNVLALGFSALQRLTSRPSFVEHGGLVSEALSGEKDMTDRYVGVCASIHAAAAAGYYPDVRAAAARMGRVERAVYTPDEAVAHIRSRIAEIPRVEAYCMQAPAGYPSPC